MKTYVIAFLKQGPNRDLDSAKAIELQITEEGKLDLAGPFFGTYGERTGHKKWV